LRAFRTTLFLALLVLVSLRASPMTFSQRTAYPLMLQDDLGRAVTIQQAPRRIVSLVPSATTVLFGIGGGGQVVGVTTDDRYPAELVQRVSSGSIVLVGRGFTPNKEVIALLRPDLLIGDGPSHRQILRTAGLEDMGFPVVYFSREDIDGIFNIISSMGRITDHQERAQSLISGMRLRIDSLSQLVRDATVKPRVYVEVFSRPLISVGNGTLTANLLQLAGGINIFADSPVKFPEVSPESVIQRNPDVIVVVSDTPTDVQSVKSRPGWASISAVRNNRVFVLDPQLVSPSQRIVEGLEAMASAIHPTLVRSLTITLSTSPAVANVRFLVDGREVLTGPDGKATITTATGSHVVVLQNTSVAVGGARRNFVSWSGAASGSANPLSITLISDGSIVANYSPCLIVTATYGSRLGDQINLLRRYRDGIVMADPAGRAFMGIFDSYYYSFSPAIASALAQARGAIWPAEALLFPLLAALMLSAALAPLVGPTLGGLLSAFLLGASYMWPTALIAGRRNPRRMRRLSGKLLQLTCFVSTSLFLSTALGVTPLSSFLAAAVVLSGIAAGAALVPAILYWRRN